MGLVDRLFKKPDDFPVITRTPSGISGRMTAHQAWAVAAPMAKAADDGARLTLITSGLDLDRQGCSRTWDFLFYLPNRTLTMMLSLEPDPQSEELEIGPVIVTTRTHKASSSDSARPAFPDRFRDSPDVVAELSAHGVDFVAGPSDMKLEGRMRSSGDAVWVTYYWDQEFIAAFSAMTG
ncbi:MAG: hypothetical protein WC713_05130 [Candidatus Methylomirabilota bacterium]